MKSKSGLAAQLIRNGDQSSCHPGSISSSQYPILQSLDRPLELDKFHSQFEELKSASSAEYKVLDKAIAELRTQQQQEHLAAVLNAESFTGKVQDIINMEVQKLFETTRKDPDFRGSAARLFGSLDTRQTQPDTIRSGVSQVSNLRPQVLIDEERLEKLEKTLNEKTEAFTLQYNNLQLMFERNDKELKNLLGKFDRDSSLSGSGRIADSQVSKVESIIGRDTSLEEDMIVDTGDDVQEKEERKIPDPLRQSSGSNGEYAVEAGGIMEANFRSV